MKQLYLLPLIFFISSYSHSRVIDERKVMLVLDKDPREERAIAIVYKTQQYHQAFYTCPSRSIRSFLNEGELIQFDVDQVCKVELNIEDHDQYAAFHETYYKSVENLLELKESYKINNLISLGTYGSIASLAGLQLFVAETIPWAYKHVISDVIRHGDKSSYQKVGKFFGLNLRADIGKKIAANQEMLTTKLIQRPDAQMKSMPLAKFKKIEKSIPFNSEKRLLNSMSHKLRKLRRHRSKAKRVLFISAAIGGGVYVLNKKQQNELEKRHKSLQQHGDVILGEQPEEPASMSEIHHTEMTNIADFFYFMRSLGYDGWGTLF